MIKYKVLAARDEDLDRGFIWVTKNESFSAGQSVLKVKNKKTGRSLSVEIRTIDGNFKKKYNEKNRTINIDDNLNYVVASEWYRQKLGIDDTNQDVELEISPHRCNWFGEYCASWSHPQSSIRQSSLLALISLVLGLVSLFVSICPLIHN